MNVALVLESVFRRAPIPLNPQLEASIKDLIDTGKYMEFFSKRLCEQVELYLEYCGAINWKDSDKSSALSIVAHLRNNKGQNLLVHNDDYVHGSESGPWKTNPRLVHGVSEPWETLNIRFPLPEFYVSKDIYQRLYGRIISQLRSRLREDPYQLVCLPSLEFVNRTFRTSKISTMSQSEARRCFEELGLIKQLNSSLTIVCNPVQENNNSAEAALKVYTKKKLPDIAEELVGKLCKQYEQDSQAQLQIRINRINLIVKTIRQMPIGTTLKASSLNGPWDANTKRAKDKYRELLSLFEQFGLIRKVKEEKERAKLFEVLNNDPVELMNVALSIASKK